MVLHILGGGKTNYKHFYYLNECRIEAFPRIKHQKGFETFRIEKVEKKIVKPFQCSNIECRMDVSLHPTI